MRTALILGERSPRLGGAIHAGSEEQRRRVQTVLAAYPGGDPDAFLVRVRAGEVPLPSDPDTLFPRPLPYAWAVEAIVLKLLWPDSAAKPGAHLLKAFRKRTGGHLGPPLERTILGDLVAEHDLQGVVTTAYDTTAERALGSFHYGGLPRPQYARGADAWEYYNEPDPESAAVELDGPLPVCKLHGSLNWDLDGTIWRDMRVPSRDPARAAIAVRLEPVWSEARKVLAAADRWIVAGVELDAIEPLTHGLRPAEISHVTGSGLNGTM
jgi:hypothetical protein